MKRRTAFLALLTLFLLTAPSSLSAGGMEFPENGTQALGRAGAFVAKADDPTAIVLNPAGLGWVKGYNVLFDNNLTKQDLCFKRDGNYPGQPAPYSYAGQPYPKICRSLDGIFYVPMVAASADFGLKNWTFALGGYGPHAVGRRQFPMTATVQDSEGRNIRAPGPTRYHTDDMNIILMFYTLAAAYRPLPWLSFGAALQIVYAEMNYATWVPLSASQDPDSDVRFEILTKGVNATGILSTLMNPVKGLWIGLSTRLPARLQTKGDAWLRLPAYMAALGAPLQWMDGKQKAEMPSDLPLAVRSGIRYAWKMPNAPGAPDLADLEFDFIWERWSAIVSMDTKMNASLLDQPMEVFALNHFYQDVTEFRLGGSFTIPRRLGGGWLTLRLGTYFGSDASPKAYTRMNYAAWARTGIFTGLSYRIAGVDLHLGFAHIWNGTGDAWKPWTFRATRRVDASCVQPISAFDAPAPVRCDPYALSETLQRSDISRGTWKGAFTVFSLGFNVRFDELYGAIKKER